MPFADTVVNLHAVWESVASRHPAAKVAVADIVDVLGAGGLVVYPILGLAVMMWFFIGLRTVRMRRGLPRSPARRRRALERRLGGDRARGGVLGRALEAALEALRHPNHDPRLAVRAATLPEVQRLGAYRNIVRSATIAAPLLGLLGTVSGMIETFSSLGDMSLFAASGGVAGGISEALITTQLGLFVAIPGHLVGRMLDRREARLRSEIEDVELTVHSVVLTAGAARAATEGVPA